MKPGDRASVPEVPALKDGEKIVGPGNFWINCCDCGLRHLICVGKEGEFFSFHAYRDEWGTSINRSTKRYKMSLRKKGK